ncbi:hypothetical protein OBBRIDRAFT_609900 [Obba rivulosa]|uniref:Uncharacterized protein n=1 Tax=Obba rivulosa TaxID=1052685 RepID=A0A8E2AXZ7_9APHY|nr:hypothetical protein OBBRIDRAFT_609900 [Obba rivulosa]
MEFSLDLAQCSQSSIPTQERGPRQHVSSLSAADFKERQDDSRREQLQNRERKWNHPRASPRVSLTERTSTGSSSPASHSSRRNSTTSLQQAEDGFSSKASSVGSRQEDLERAKEVAQERNKEREREWNRRFSKYPRRPSTESQPDIPRVRKSSLPSPSDPSFMTLTPNRLRLFRHHSRNSVSSTGSAESPVASVFDADTTRGRDAEVDPNVETEPEDDQVISRAGWRYVPERSLPPTTVSPSRFTGRLSSFLSRSRPSLRPDRDGGDGTLEAELAPAPSNARELAGEKSAPRPRTPQPLDSENVPPSSSPSRRQIDGKDERGPSPAQHSRFGWHYFQNRASLSPLELDDSRSMTLSPPPKVAGSVRSHIPVRSPRKVGKASSSESIGERTSAKRNLRKSVLTAEDLFEEHLRPEPGRSEKDIMPISPLDVPMFASEDESPAATSTPTMSSQGLAEAQAARSPSPISQVALTRDRVRESDLHHEVLAKSLTPPPSPPEEQQRPDFTLQTPPRRPPVNASTLEFQTPSPPKGMPDLPEPPSESEDDAYGDLNTPRARTPEFTGNLTAMKTPRPPGAWAPTPVPSRSVANEPIPRSQSTPPGADNAFKEPQETPIPALLRSNSLPMRTPVPPGGWVPTPGNSTRRKSILKVRFDIESDIASDSAAEKAPVASSSSQMQPGSKTEAAEDLKANVTPKTDPLGPDEVGFDTRLDGTPRTSPVERRKLRKTPTLRIVDAYGRETTDPEPAAEEPAAIDVKISKEEAPARVDISTVPTPRKRKGNIRILDAMGREIEEPEEEYSLDVGSMPRNEVLKRAQETIAHLADDLQEADRSFDGMVVHQHRVDELHNTSKAARTARDEISKNLQSVKQKQAFDLKSKYDRLREGMRNSRLMSVTMEQPLRTWRLPNPWVVWGFLILQAVLLLVMYRLSVIRAKRMFLTTYYDPFYPDLYLHITKSDTFSYFIPLPSWSFSSLSDTLGRAGWSGVVAEGWGNATRALYYWVRPTWDLPFTRSQGRMSWPPT